MTVALTIIGLIIFALLAARFVGFSSEPSDNYFALNYACPRCEHAWVDFWDSVVDSECPHCGLRHIEPLFSDNVKKDLQC